VWRAAFEGLLEDDFSGEHSKIRIPTLILWGDQDAYFPRSDQDTLAASIADSQLVVYPGVGHALHWEEPERFAADLVSFVKRLAR
jgi:pimeloyl-ACP methyl ester carboxylesterase